MFAAMALILMAQVAADPSVPVRTPVASFPIIPAKPVTHVEAMRVDFPPGQQMPEHMHPVPVVCFVAKGNFAVSIGSAPVRTVRLGEATLERAGEVVHYFRNLSTTDTAQLYCSVLAGADDKQLSVMLPK
jgi:quercetin dioxygenase-like cupin family protein